MTERLENQFMLFPNSANQTPKRQQPSKNNLFVPPCFFSPPNCSVWIQINLGYLGFLLGLCQTTLMEPLSFFPPFFPCWFCLHFSPKPIQFCCEARGKVKWPTKNHLTSSSFVGEFYLHSKASKLNLPLSGI